MRFAETIAAHHWLLTTGTPNQLKQFQRHIRLGNRVGLLRLENVVPQVRKPGLLVFGCRCRALELFFRHRYSLPSLTTKSSI